MINLKVNLKAPDNLKPGKVIHLKIMSMKKTSPGKWEIRADDVTPLPGAEIGYFCRWCGLVMEAKEDGSLPEGWVERKYEQGSHYNCPQCKDVPVCRVCGCDELHACNDDEEPCSWMEDNLCSACATPKK